MYYTGKHWSVEDEDERADPISDAYISLLASIQAETARSASISLELRNHLNEVRNSIASLLSAEVA